MSVRKFVEDPTVDNLLTCVKLKDDWIYVAKRFNISYVCSITRSELGELVIRKLVVMEILPDALSLLEQLDPQVNI